MMSEKTAKIFEKIKTIRKEYFPQYIKEELSAPLPTISEFLYDYIINHNLSAAEVIKNSGLSKDYAYAILNGNRTNPTRDRVIALCLAMKMSFDDACSALALCKNLLYPQDKRDAAIILCFYQKIYDINDVNLFLNENGLAVLETAKNFTSVSSG
ncbi:MAG: helix-turn-helix domain-containing protein [Lachnospiraceae bacterium]|nr:helix-turn-helix domain-containing protein [Lachnospiraceae bacterium]